MLTHYSVKRLVVAAVTSLLVSVLGIGIGEGLSIGIGIGGIG